MEAFSALLVICAGVHRSPVNSPHGGQWRGALVFSLVCVWVNEWVDGREAGDLGRCRAHYDVIVMMQMAISTFSIGGCATVKLRPKTQLRKRVVGCHLCKTGQSIYLCAAYKVQYGIR